MIINTTTRIWHVSLTVEILACIEANDDYPEDAIGMIAREAISLFPTGQKDVSLEIENIEVTDIIRTKETGKQQWTRR